MTNYLITEAYLKATTSVKIQKDIQDIKRVLTIVEGFYIEELLGKPLYGFFKSYVSSTAPEPLSTLEEELFNRIKLYCALMAEWEIMFNLFDIGNKGNSANEDAASIELVKLKRGEVLSKAEHIKERILRFLQDHRESFSNYFPATQIKQVRAEGFSPVVFDHAPKHYYGL